MFSKLRGNSDPAPRPESQAVARISLEVGALRQPSPSLYYAYFQERMRARRDQIYTLTTAIEATRLEAMAAAIRLASLDASKRCVFSSFTELVSQEGNA
jgi:hypothetical protein